MIPDDRFYTEDHQWLRPDEAFVEVGVTEPLVRKLSPLIAIQMLDADDEMKSELPFAELEGAEVTHHLYPAAEARIIEVNDALLCEIDVLAEDPYGAGWLVRLEVQERRELQRLMTAHSYRKYCEEEFGKGYVDG